MLTHSHRRWWWILGGLSLLLPVSIGGVSVEVVNTYKYLGVHLDSKLDWSANIDAIYKKGLSRLYFLRRLRSFNVCNKLLRMFYQSVVASVLFYAVVCWGGSIKKRDAGYWTGWGGGRELLLALNWTASQQWPREGP